MEDINKTIQNLPELGTNEMYVVFIDKTVSVGKFMGFEGDSAAVVEANGIALYTTSLIYDNEYKLVNDFCGAIRDRNIAIKLYTYTYDRTGYSHEMLAYGACTKEQVAEALKVEHYFRVSRNLKIEVSTIKYDLYKTFTRNAYKNEFRDIQKESIRRAQGIICRYMAIVNKSRKELSEIGALNEEVSMPKVGEKYLWGRLKVPRTLVSSGKKFYTFSDKAGKVYALSKDTKLYTSYNQLKKDHKTKKLNMTINNNLEIARSYYMDMKNLMSKKPYFSYSESTKGDAL